MDESAVLDAVKLVCGTDFAAADETACRAILQQSKRGRGFFDAAEAMATSRLAILHATAGGAPPADVHTRCGGVSAAEGKRKERRSKTIDQAPSFGDALADGRIGAEHVDALANATSKLDAPVRDALLECEGVLLTDAGRMTPEQFARSVRDLTRRLEHDQGMERNRRQRRDTYLSRRMNPATGMIEGRFALHPELGSQIFGAIDREVAAIIRGGEQRGDADFVARRYDRNRLAAEALGTLIAGGHQAVRPLEADITVIADADTITMGELHDHTICETADGAPLPPATIRRLLCQGRITPVIVDTNGVTLNVGRTIRHANRAQRRALRAMYRCCGFGDCDIVFDRCEIHHMHPWELGGPTDMSNLLPLCSRHHHTVHEGGWRLDLDTDRTLTITQPDNTIYMRCRPDITQQRTKRRQPAA